MGCPFDVPADSFEITYAAHTASCTFLLDAEGMCRRIVMAPGKRRDSSRTAARCVGAQYVASLDPAAAGCLVEMPRIGSAMLFARVDERGRVSLVRTGVVTQFETLRQEDPFAETSGVATSAPDLTPRTPKIERDISEPDPDYFDASERTQRIQAVHAEDLVRTAEYTSEPAEDAPPRTTLPSPATPQAATLRNPHVELGEEDDNPYARRGMLPRGRRESARALRAGDAARSARVSWPSAPGSDVKLAGRRRR